MPFQIHALDPAPFAPLFKMDDAALSRRNARRVRVDACPGAPCRVSLRDAPVGETVILVNHVHLDAPGPYRASHAIYVRASVPRSRPAPDTVPDALRRRDLSLRAIGPNGSINDAALTPGAGASAEIERLLARDDVAEVHVHFAARGCYAARATRV